MSSSRPEEQLAAYARRLPADRLTTGTGGNLSLADRAGKRIFITPSGLPYDRLTPDRIAVIDFSGRPETAAKPSSEWQLHLEIYRSRPEVNAIVHTHSPFATTFAVLNQPIPACHYLVGVSGGNEIRVAPYATFGTPELAAVTREALGRENCILMANHGLIAVGGDLVAAYHTALYIEEAAELYWRARTLGEPVVLTPEEMEKARRQLGIYTGSPEEN